jgi:hypothetical protein
VIDNVCQDDQAHDGKVHNRLAYITTLHNHAHEEFQVVANDNEVNPVDERFED